MDALTKEKKKRLMQWPKGDLAERLLFAYSTIQSLEEEKLQLAKSLYMAANDFTSSNGYIPEWWKDCKEIARKGGFTISEAKKKASAENGKNGQND